MKMASILYGDQNILMIVSRWILPGCRKDSGKRCREKSNKKANVRI